MNILDGNKLAKQIKEEIKEEVSKLTASGKRAPHLAAILVGDDGASETYVNAKAKDCERVGYSSTVLRYNSDTSEKELLAKIEEINNNPDIDGLIVQLPLPKHISALKVTETISPNKDVDGFHTTNVGKLTKNLPTFISATPYGIVQLLKRNHIDTSGKHCVVIGRSDIVGRPMSLLMSRNDNPGNCTVTICHSRTKNIEQFTKMADILIAALGKPEFITADMVKEGAVIIDVGITRVNDSTKERGYSLKGDVKFDEVAEKASHITPVPGGVGPMTRMGLLQNTLKAYKQNYLQ